MNAKVLAAMTEQIKHELESSYLYLSMVAYFESQNLEGMAHWMRIQTHEETLHAMKFFGHIIERNADVKLADLKQHKTSWASPLEAWEDAYKHEQFISGKINDLMTVVREEKDYGAESLVHWFVDEQIEEESNALKVLELFKQLGDSKHGLIMLDRELKGRPAPSGSPWDPRAAAAG